MRRRAATGRGHGAAGERAGPAVEPDARAAPRGAAAARGAESFYADSRVPGAQVRVCRGISCELSGAGRVADALESLAWCREVYCLGYCDRSPAVLRADGALLTEAEPSALRRWLDEIDPARPGSPRIRCAAREPVVTRRIAEGDHADLERALGAGVYAGLERALRQTPERVIEEIERAGERGRGGSGFPTGQKWRSCSSTPADVRYVVANGDEGDPGSYIDRLLLELDPHAVLEGLLLCGYAVRASQGFVCIRSEYPRARARVERAVDQARRAGIVGKSVLGSAFDFEVDVVAGKGSYVCGEETALLNSLEGRRGEVRLRPPYPAESGLAGRPTVVNNVESLVNAAWIAARGADAYRALGTAVSPGTKAVCLSRDFGRPGVVEVEFGIPLGEIVVGLGGGGRDGRALAAVWLGGPMGSVLAPEAWDVPLCYETLGARGVRLGHAGLVALPEDVDFRALLEHALRFVASESCGKCAPCAIGSAEALALARGEQLDGARARLERLLDVMRDTSLCAFGQQAPGALVQLLERVGDPPHAGRA